MPSTSWIFDELVAAAKARGESPPEDRISRIRNAITSPGSEHDGVMIKYISPWSDVRSIEADSVDVIVSHAVLEHVVDLEGAYRALHRWLKPGGMMSHQIDFTSHRTAEKWNGYRAYSEFLWKIIVGRRPYLINRQPCSTHVDLLKSSGFEILSMKRIDRTDGIRRSQLSSRWKNISDDDLVCSDLTVQARKR
jgi:SAM-dependent methyltransferase